MNLSEPLDGLTSAVEAAVLRVLARADAAFSGRQVHALAGAGSTSSVHRALGGLVALGLVTAEPVPPAIRYRMNREHVLWPVIELALTARDRVMEGIEDFCFDHAPDETEDEARISVTLYGSVARRESGPESDVDLLVVFPDAFDDDARADFAYRLAEQVERLSGNDAQVFTLTRSEVRRRVEDGDPFVSNVVRDGETIYGPTPVPGLRAREVA